jgi:CO dehydrogenase maturation factor
VRVAVVGKGGAGKSVVAGTLARLAARAGARVLALDSDPLPGLSLSLGAYPEPAAPLLLGAVQQDERGYWSWRDGLGPVGAALQYASPAPDGVRLVQRGKVGPEGFGAIIGSSKAFVEMARGLVDAPEFRDWTLIGDLPAGPMQVAENWAPYARIYLTIVQPSLQSALTAMRVARIARQSPAEQVLIVANRVRSDDDVDRIQRWMGEPVFAAVPADDVLAVAERLGVAPIDHAPDSPAITALGGVFAALR